MCIRDRLHRALFGSLERFTGIIIEHYAGHLPFWLSPLQIVVATITSESDNYAFSVKDQLVKNGFLAEVDIRNEKIGYKIREHSKAKVPVILAVGKKEADEKTVSVRRLGSQETATIKLDELIKSLQKESLSPIN